MNALDKDVLKSALEIQQTIVGGEKLTAIPALNEKLRSSTLSWGYHSPLMYWNNSADEIGNDEDLIQTINDQSRTSSSLNVALRPASVFAGKKFDRWKLRAADALVITLMNKVEDGKGGRWDDQMKSLAAGVCENCTLFPCDGHVTRNRVYEFSFMPLSMHENLALTFAYSCMALYVLLSLRRLKAFHSRFGLVVTAITQMTCSVLASFTICAVLKINLSMIPQNAYPFVVLVIGLENMFRLINAVVAYPPTMATDQRIANALGEVGPVSVATAAQNLLILSLLTWFVSPGVAAFCAFACIATLFDAFLLLTFFVAVLNVDIRRFELQDALARSTQQKAKRRPSPAKHREHTWFDAMVHGRLPFSTRMAGTAVTTTFILSLNYHFFERHEQATSLRQLLSQIRDGPAIAEFDTFTPPPMNATLTPGEWMRMQDFDTAKEVMRLAKPGADSFVIRVFAPLIVVLGGADRTGAPLGTKAWTHALSGFAIHHFYPVAVAVVFAVAFVAVLMNFLLYSDTGDESFSDDERFEEALSVQSVALPHKLDIIKLSATDKGGHFVTVGLDRTIAISVYDRSQQAHTTVGLPADVLSTLRWPIRRCELSENGDLLALLCADDRIALYSCATSSLLDHDMQYPDDNPPLLFRFFQVPCKDASKDSSAKTWLMVVTSGGRLVMSCTGSSEPSIDRRLSETPLLGAVLLEVNSHCRKLFVATEDARLVCYKWVDSTWGESHSASLPVETVQGRIAGAVSIDLYPDLGPDTLAVSTLSALLFTDSNSLATLGKLALDEPIKQLVLGNVTRCPACAAIAFRSIGLVGESQQDGSFSVTVLMGGDDGEASSICLRLSGPSCQSLDRARRTKHQVESVAGADRSLSSHAVLGLRRQQKLANGGAGAEKRTSPSHVHHRRRTSLKPQDGQGEWEAYKLSLDGEVETAMVPSELNTDGSDALYVNTAGPTVILDHQSIAVAFGNQVKVIRTSRRASLARSPNGPPLERHSSTFKRRLTLRKAQ